MSDFSMSPLEVLLANRRNGYVGLHIEQGVPLLDRDLNLLQDLLVAGMRSLFTRYVGEGVPAGTDGFRISAGTGGERCRISSSARARSWSAGSRSAPART
ncbi:hypothetical protein [Paractinoplanes durhamensis]|uniref:hypothetical protein n=1 Tax=Paractinoplanes durhamensis TaxID=113563 RepID=UPI0036395E62